MTARSGKFLPVGLRMATVFALDSNGRPLATGTTAYEGLSWEGALAYSMTIPDAQKKTHKGNDGVIGIAHLPPQDGPSGSLRVSDHRHDIKALVTGIPVITLAESKIMPIFTDQEGRVPDVGLLVYRQSQDLDSGEETWNGYVVPRCKLVPKASDMGSGDAEVTYQIFPKMVNQFLWGETFVKATHGFKRGAFFDLDCEGKPTVIGFLGDGTTTEFSFPTGKEALSVDKVAVYQNGVEVTTGESHTVEAITFSSAPADGDMITVFYEI